ncbi:MAG: excinuclease ABC subunit UvrC, partial [Deltaproteobacteria bacterium]|nr:excinuclease ABC subunit UvrC [Deltaproteobacteria bacterium]
ENNIIKEHRPRYNVYFRDDKTYVSLRVDLREPFPWLQLVRRVKKDGAKYLGPYPSGFAAKETLHFLQQVFPLRTCSDRVFRQRRRPCIEYEIKRCLGPCVGLVTRENYQGLIMDVVAFLEGRGRGLLQDLEKRMENASGAMEFEEAARVRDRIAAIERTLEKQSIASPALRDQDVFGLYREGSLTQIFALHIRNGNILGKKKFPLVRLATDSAEIISSLLKQYYSEGQFIPEEIIIPEEIEDRDVIEEWLWDKKGRKVSILRPQKGERSRLLRMATRNAENVFKTERNLESEEMALKILREKLRLKRQPERVECFDISNIGGQFAVGSMVTFTGGKPEKAGYRHFRIRDVEGADDYAMMREVLERRYRHRGNLPDLIMVDGGKGQLGVVLSVLRELGVEGPDVIALAKGSSGSEEAHPPAVKARTGVPKEEDRVYLAGRKDPVYISRYPAAYFFIQRIRDEAHRFAITHHRKIMEKRTTRSLLDDIPGVGPKRKKALLSHFGDIAGIREASPEELAAVGRMSRHTAEIILDHLRVTHQGERKKGSDTT